MWWLALAGGGAAVLWHLLRFFHARRVAQIEALEPRIAAALAEGDFQLAHEHSQRAAQISRETRGIHRDTVSLLLRSAFVAGLANKTADADAARTDALDMAGRLPPQDKPLLAQALMAMAGDFRAKGDIEASTSHWRDALAVWEAMGTPSPEWVQCHSQLVQLYDQKGHPNKADAHMTAAYRISTQLDDPPPFVAENYIGRHTRRGRLSEARRVCALLFAQKTEAEHGALRSLLVAIHLKAHAFEEAEKVAREQLTKGDPADQGYSLRLLGRTLLACQKWEDAADTARRYLTLQAESLGEDHPATCGARTMLAKAYRAQNRGQEARVLAERNIEMLKKVLEERENPVWQAELDEVNALLAVLIADDARATPTE